ncbi:MucR family transcriptional regulator [Gluconacetobacter sacchari]|uniref:MucR family transcriptional regulator n=1 Tax=Gluconacetobacter sacchari TaxID=92759 RepID=UPI0039B3B995
MSNNSADAVFLARLNAMTQIVTAHLATTKVETDRLARLVEELYASIPTPETVGRPTGRDDATPVAVKAEASAPTADPGSSVATEPASMHSVAAREPAPPPVKAASEKSVRPVPAVPIKESVYPDFVVCLEDGKKFKSLKRHLMSAYGMSVADYKEKWGLPDEYPTVAPNYTAARRKVAQSIGLGRRSSGEEPVPETQKAGGGTAVTTKASRSSPPRRSTTDDKASRRRHDDGGLLRRMQST